jgi:hypothetical protein
MKRIITATIAWLLMFPVAQAQQDLSIAYTNYTEGQYIGYGNILTEFTITNNGTQDLLAGDTLLLAAKFNNVVYDMYLNKQDSVTLWKLTSDLPVGGTLTLNPGFLIGYSWASSPIWKVADGSLTLTLMVYGVGLDSWNSNYAEDANPADNKTTIIYDNVDLEVFFNHYNNKEVTNKATIDPTFTLVNHGPTDIKAGETLYLRTKINNVLYSLALMPGDTTKYLLTSDFEVGDSITINPGYIDGALTAMMLGADTVQIGVLIYGVGKSSVASNFRADGNKDDNTVLVTYNPLATDDLAIDYTNYTEGQYIGYGNIQTEFFLINRGETTLHAGDTVLLAAKFNNVVYDMYLNKQDSVTLWVLADDLNPGDTLTLNPGFLIGYSWASSSIWRVADGSLTLTLMVYGKGLASWNSNFADDANPADNKTSIVYDNVDLEVFYNHYNNKEVTNKSIIDPTFTLVNHGPTDIKAGETLYLRTKINNQLYSLAIVPNDTTKYLLTSDFKVGDSITINPGYIDGALTAMLLGADTVQIGVLIYGVGKSSVASNFRADGNKNDNTVLVTYNPAATNDLAIDYVLYTEGQQLGYGNIQTAFYLINHGQTTLHAGDSVLLAVRFNNIEYDMFLNKVDSVTFWKLNSDLEPGDTLMLNPGYLIGYQWLYWLPASSLELSLVVYGEGLASWNSGFSWDSNPADNISSINYDNVDLSIELDNYSSNEITTNTTLQSAFTITNNGPVTIKAGQKIYLGVKLNGNVFDLDLFPGDTTEYTLTSDLNVQISTCGNRINTNSVVA